MRVLGHEIPQATIDRALAWFPPDRAFTLSDMRGALIRMGVTWEGAIADRAADRILQQCKKAGTHVYSKGRWKRQQIRAAAE